MHGIVSQEEIILVLAKMLLIVMFPRKYCKKLNSNNVEEFHESL